MAETTAVRGSVNKDNLNTNSDMPDSPPKLKNIMENEENRRKIGEETATVTPPKALTGSITTAVFGGSDKDDEHDPPTINWFEYISLDKKWKIHHIPKKTSRMILRDKKK